MLTKMRKSIVSVNGVSVNGVSVNGVSVNGVSVNGVSVNGVSINNNEREKKKIFYVCSYGGCGSKMLCEYLYNFGTFKHVHSRNPPTILTHIGLQADWHEWFSTIPVNAQELHNYYVIYIYRDPIKAIQSRFTQPEHLRHIQSNPAITLDKVINSKQDLYGIENFFDNYTNPTTKRNYKIYCVKYEDLFTNIEELNRVLGINCTNKAMYPRDKGASNNDSTNNEELQKIYGNLKRKMDRMKFITII